jgi:maltose O-acetyltransferase
MNVNFGNRVVTRLSRYKLFIYAYRLVSSCVLKFLWVLGNVIFQLRVQNKGSGCVCHWNVEIKSPENLLCGNHVVIGPNVTIGAEAEVVLNDHARISKGVVIETGSLDFSTEIPYSHVSKPISIGENVWLCTNAIILAGITVGAGAIVAAGAVVTKDVPPNAIVAGNPARITSYRS